MGTRGHGLMRSKRATRLVALLLVVGVVVGFSVSYLVQAGLPMSIVIPVVLLVLGVPAFLVWYSDRGHR